MAVQNKVSLPVIKRLPKYYRYLTNLSADGKDKISSSELAHMMGTTASQVRQDFNCFGGFGQQGIGYKVDVLRAEIGKLLFGDGEKLPTILVGAGRLGSAVSSFISRDANGYKLLGVFDVNPDLIGKEMCGVPILPLSELEAFAPSTIPRWPCSACRARALWTWRVNWWTRASRVSGISATTICRSSTRTSRWRMSIWATA